MFPALALAIGAAALQTPCVVTERSSSCQRARRTTLTQVRVVALFDQHNGRVSDERGPAAFYLPSPAGPASFGIKRGEEVQGGRVTGRGARGRPSRQKHHGGGKTKQENRVCFSVLKNRPVLFCAEGKRAVFSFLAPGTHYRGRAKWRGNGNRNLATTPKGRPNGPCGCKQCTEPGGPPGLSTTYLVVKDPRVWNR